MKCNSLSVLGIASASLFIGCAADEPTLQAHEQPTIVLNRIALNGIIANRVAATAIAENPLAVGRSETILEVNPVSDPLLRTAEGREYLAYIVSCAMPAGTSVEAGPYSFGGSVGLAPDWEHRGLTDSEKRWVSACLLARVNAYGISVAISMRGDHGALLPTDDERSAFGQSEGAFYGNVFSELEDRMEMFACRGAAQAAGEGGGLVDRDCAEPAGNGLTVCGFRYVGDCVDFSPQTPTAHACASGWDNEYQDCHTRPSAGLWEPRTGYAEVITTFVANP
jgi:hypothetical protein